MAADDYGIIIAQPGASIGSANKSQIALNTSNPMLKIDTQNKQGFQTITLLITTDTPNPPSGGGTTYTVVYKFKHNYTYTPTVEMLCYVQTPPPNDAGNAQTYFQDRGEIGSPDGSLSVAFFYCYADSQYVYFVAEKSYDSRANGAGIAYPILSGTNLVISTHVFVEQVM